MLAAGGELPLFGTWMRTEDAPARERELYASAGLGDLEVGLVVRMPTGSAHDFQGTGTWELAPIQYATNAAIGVRGSASVRGYPNAYCGSSNSALVPAGSVCG